MPVVRGRVRKSYRDSRILSLEKYCEGIGGGGRGNFVPFPFRVHLPRWAYAINLFVKRDTSIPIYLLFLIEINVGISNIRPFRNYSILEKIILRIGFKKKGLKDRKNRFENSPISKAGKVKRINRIAKDPSSEQTSPTSTYIDTQGDQCRDVFTRDDV